MKIKIENLSTVDTSLDYACKSGHFKGLAIVLDKYSIVSRKKKKYLKFKEREYTYQDGFIIFKYKGETLLICLKP